MLTPYVYGKYKTVNLYMVEMFKKACFCFFWETVRAFPA